MARERVIGTQKHDKFSTIYVICTNWKQKWTLHATCG